MQPYTYREMDGASHSKANLGTPRSVQGASSHCPQSIHFSPFDSSTARGLPHSVTLPQLPLPVTERRANKSSATWTSSSGDLACLSDTDDVQDRPEFALEYNRLATKHGIRPFPIDGPDTSPTSRSPQPRRGWFSRTFLRPVSGASHTGSAKTDKKIGHKHSVGDMAMHIMKNKRDPLKDEDLQSLVRLCGKNILYLPSEYAPGSLILPTCIRATAQYLIHHATDTRGIFRIPGSIRIVNALYDYYCAEADVDEIISSTIRCPSLPQHIKAGTHDVASTFKRLLAGLPGGILGSLSLLDALVAIHGQLKGDPEFIRTKQTKLRGRLIALAVGTVRSQFRRELICAVFGLLCLIGRTAENAPREDDDGRPLPTVDLMGYNALGIVFGPLLVGDLINSYTMKLADPGGGVVLSPITPPRTRKEKQKGKVSERDSPIQSIDKIHVANAITEMLITHWREVVRQMRSLGVLRSKLDNPCDEGAVPNVGLRPSTSEYFIIRKPSEWRYQSNIVPYKQGESPAPPSPTPETRRASNRASGPKNSRPSLVVRRVRTKGARSLSSTRSVKPPVQILSPATEEPSVCSPEAANIFSLTPSTFKMPLPSMQFAAPAAGPGEEVEQLTSQSIQEAATKDVTNAQARHHDNGATSAQIPRAVSGRSKQPPRVDEPSRRKGCVVSKDSIRVLKEAESHLVLGSETGRSSERRTGNSPKLSRVGKPTTSPITVPTKRGSRGPQKTTTTASNENQSRTPMSKPSQSVDAATTPRSHQEPLSPGLGKEVDDRTEANGHTGGIWLELSEPNTEAHEFRQLHDRQAHSEGHVPVTQQFPTTRGQSSAPQADTHSPSQGDSPQPKAMRSDVVTQIANTTARMKFSRGPKEKAKTAGTSASSTATTSTKNGTEDVMKSASPTDCQIKLRPRSQATVANSEPSSERQNTWPSIDMGGMSVTSRPGQNLKDTSRGYKPQSKPVTPSRTCPLGSVRSTVREMAAKFESASKDQKNVPSPERAVMGPVGKISRSMINPLINRGSTSPIRPSDEGAVHSERSYGTTTIKYTRLPSATETVIIRDRSSSPGRQIEPTGGTEDDERQWIRRITSESGVHEYHGLLSTSSDDAADPKNLRGRNLRHSLLAPSNGTGSDVKLRLRPVTQGAQLESTIWPRVSGSSKAHPMLQHTVIISSPKDQDGRQRMTVSPQSSSVPDDDISDRTLSSGNKPLALHAQIRSLQKQLKAKTDEVNQLRRLLEAKQDADSALLREQFRAMERECALWRDRAEKAEIRIAASAKATARALKLRQGLRTGKESAVPAVDGLVETEEELYGDDEMSVEGDQRVYDWLKSRQQDSSGGDTEDEEILTERIRHHFEAMGEGNRERELWDGERRWGRR